MLKAMAQGAVAGLVGTAAMTVLGMKPGAARSLSRANWPDVGMRIRVTPEVVSSRNVPYSAPSKTPAVVTGPWNVALVSRILMLELEWTGPYSWSLLPNAMVLGSTSVKYA